MEKCLNYEFCQELATYNDTFCLTCFKAHDLGYNMGYNDAIIQQNQEE